MTDTKIILLSASLAVPGAAILMLVGALISLFCAPLVWVVMILLAFAFPAAVQVILAVVYVLLFLGCWFFIAEDMAISRGMK